MKTSFGRFFYAHWGDLRFVFAMPFHWAEVLEARRREEPRRHDVKRDARDGQPEV